MSIIVCGDSWMSPKIKFPQTHFSEIFARYLNLDLISYARSAMSNGGIFLQIEEAIKQKPKLILIGTTNTDRIEFSIQPFQDQTEVKLSNLYYGSHYDDISSNDFAYGVKTLKSEALRQFIEDAHSPALDPLNIDNKIEKFNAIKLYFKELYHPGWKAKLDQNLWYSIVHKLCVSNIPYIICYNADHSMFNRNLIPFLEDKNEFWQKFSTFRKPISSDMDPGYHTSIETQKHIATELIEHYEKYFNTSI